MAQLLNGIIMSCHGIYNLLKIALLTCLELAHLKFIQIWLPASFIESVHDMPIWYNGGSRLSNITKPSLLKFHDPH